MARIVRNKSGDERTGMTESTSLGAVTLEAVNASGGDTVIGAKALSKGEASVDYTHAEGSNEGAYSVVHCIFNIVDGR